MRKQGLFQNTGGYAVVDSVLPLLGVILIAVVAALLVR